MSWIDMDIDEYPLSNVVGLSAAIGIVIIVFIVTTIQIHGGL